MHGGCHSSPPHFLPRPRPRDEERAEGETGEVSPAFFVVGFGVESRVFLSGDLDPDLPRRSSLEALDGLEPAELVFLAEASSSLSMGTSPPRYLLKTKKAPQMNRPMCVAEVMRTPTHWNSFGKPGGTWDVVRVQNSAPAIATIAQSPARRVPHLPEGITSISAITRCVAATVNMNFFESKPRGPSTIWS